MRVMYLHQHFSTPEKGSGTRSYEFGRRLVKKGHTVTVITGNSCLKLPMGREPYRAIDVEGMEVIVLNAPYASTMVSGQRIRSFFNYAHRARAVGRRLPRPDVVLATSTPLTVALPGIGLSRKFRVPLVFEVRDLWPEAPIQMGALRNPLAITAARMLERKAYRRAVRIIALSPGMIAGVLQQGASVEKLEFIPNSSDLEFFTPGPPVPDLLERYGLDGKFLAVYAGNVGPSADLEILLAAAALSPDNIAWVVAGEGHDLQDLKRKAAKAGLLDRVHFLGHLSKFEVADLYRCAGCVLVLFRNLPVLSTNSPNKFFDALAAGRPVITNMTGWVANLLEDNHAGTGIIPGSAHELARAVEDISRRPERAAAMGRNARMLAAEKFDREILFERFEEVLTSALNTAKRR
ncbi:MAG: glycosyltransferase family 4 protein [Firmicutes bacterium]|nr:glycosyltransferase family 4 protein [Bacillota bacterium]